MKRRFVAVLIASVLTASSSMSVLAAEVEEVVSDEKPKTVVETVEEDEALDYQEMDTAEAAENEEVVLSETFSEVDANGLTWKLEGGVMTISGNGVIERNRVFTENDGLREGIISIIIEEGITGIGEAAFHGYRHLEQVSIPNSITKIGIESFGECSNLSNVSIPESVREIEEEAFAMTGLKSISLPDGLEEIKGWTFADCHSLTEVSIPDSVTKIGEGAFNGCGALALISIPKNVTEIGAVAFYYCRDLREITIPESVKSIGDGVFLECTKLQTITFKGDAPGINKDNKYEIAPFDGVTATAYYPSGNPTYTEEVKAAYGSGLTWVAKDMPKMSFTDVNDIDWYYDAADFVFSRGIMTGMTDTEFGPSVKLSRAQFATILYRMEGEPEVAYDPAAFPDVREGQFYTAPAMWAKSTGVISGYEDGRFGPADEITREQMAVMMYRYANILRLDTSAEGDMNGFPDAGRVSPFAEREVNWAVGAGLIKGDGGNVNPQGTAERAQCATIIMRFMEGYGL